MWIDWENNINNVADQYNYHDAYQIYRDKILPVLNDISIDYPWRDVIEAMCK